VQSGEYPILPRNILLIRINPKDAKTGAKPSMLVLGKVVLFLYGKNIHLCEKARSVKDVTKPMMRGSKSVSIV